MAVFRVTSYTRVKGDAKKSIKYEQNRPGRDGAKIQRTLYGIDEKMERIEAFRMIDEADRRSYYYRIIINFDAVKEDTHKDLYIPGIAERVMGGVEDRVGQSVQWVGATHDDHTPLRHVHIVAVLPKRLNRDDLRALIDLSTDIAAEQRQEQDQVLEYKKQRERGKESQWERQRSSEKHSAF